MTLKVNLTVGVALTAIFSGSVASGQERRELSAHEHGVSTMEIAVERGVVEIDLYSPGMDIVGFEYEAETAEDKDAVEAAIIQLSRPSELFVLDEAAGCRLAEVLSHLHTGDGDHEETHAHMGEGVHDEAEEAAHADGHSHDEAHARGAGEHSEFHARYRFECDNPEALQAVEMPFFGVFANAEEIEAQLISDTGASAVEVERNAPTLPLR